MVFPQFPGFQRFYESCLSGLRTTVHCKTSSRWIPSKHEVNMASTWILYDSVYIYIFYCKIWGKTHVGCFWQLLKYVLCITALAYDSSCSAGCGTTTHWVDKCCRPQACESTALKQQQQQQQGTNSRLIRTGWWFQPLWNILVSWDDYSQYVEKKHVPNHQPFNH